MEIENRETTNLGPKEGRALWVLGELVTYKVTAEWTGGAYTMFEVLVQPQGGPPPHVQHEEDEAIYVLEGEFEIFEGGETVRMGEGSLAYMPRGNAHTYKNVDQKPGRLLVSLTPSGLLERFFEEVGEEAEDLTTPPVMEDPPEVEKIVAIAAKHGLEILPPG